MRCFSPPGYVEVEETLDEEAARKVVHENCGVYRLTFNGVSVMLTGDSNLPAWKRIVSYYEGRVDENDLAVLASQVVHASHHGSRTFVKDNKGDEAWLEALDAMDPRDVVISVAAENRHEHPHEDMVSIYAKAVGEDHVLETQDSGTLVLTVTGEGTYELSPDDSFASEYGWDDDDGEPAKGSGPSGEGPPGALGDLPLPRRRVSRRPRSDHHAGSATPTPDTRKEWYEANPERLAWELAEFAARGLPAQDRKLDSGALVIDTSLPFRGEDVQVRVLFPFDYPDVEPSVLGPPQLLPRHQNRRVGNFCLLEEPTADWWPGMSAAQLVDEELRWLLEDTDAGPEAVEAGEADMPEPLSQHVSADPGWVVVVPEPFWMLHVDADCGEFVLHDKPFGGHGQVLASAEGFEAADEDLVATFSAAKGARHVGRWASLPAGALSSWPSHDEVLAAAEQQSPEVLTRLRRTLARERKRRDVEGWIGLTFIEEGPKRGQQRRGWLFLRVRLERDGRRSVTKSARALALTAAERARRVPELAGLDQARILVVGAGSVGAPIVLELAKAGVGHTDIADYDRYDVNNAVRHVLDPRWAGALKSLAVGVEAEALNPFVEVESHYLHAGGSADDSAKLDLLLSDVDLAIDATGSQVAARVLQRRCREFGKTLVLASLTAGSYGGEVAVFRPDGPCFYCFVLGQQDDLVPTPAEGPRSNTTPVGCNTPAFSGAGFDATALAALAVRTAVRASGRCSYPALDYDYVVVNFRGPDPWRQGLLATHANCPLCP